MDYQTGYFLDGKYPYVKFGSGKKKLVIFPPSRDLMCSLALNPEAEIKTYRQMLPKDFDREVYILGYDVNISADRWCREIAADFALFIEKEIGPAIIVGISYGGAVAIPFADQNPELTEKLLLLVSAYGLSDDGVILCRNLIDLAQRKGLRRVQFEIDDLILNRWIRVLIKMTHFVEWYIKKKRTNPPETFINAYTHIANYPMGLKPHLAGITAPTLIIGGEKDQFFSISQFEETAELIPNAKLIFIEGAGHPAPLEQSKLVKKEVFRFLGFY